MPFRPVAAPLSVAALLLAGLAAPTTAAVPAPVTAPGAPQPDAATLVAEATAAGSHCVSVSRDGDTVLAEDLAPGVRTTEVWSVTKSITSLLVGIAADHDLLDLDDRVARYVPQWRRTPSRKVTVRHLLSNTSGREWSIRTDYEKMAGRAPDKTRYSIGLGQDARPGRTWAYNNAAIQVLERVLEEATGQPVPVFARQRLFRPLGMRTTRFQLDGARNAMLFGGVRSTCDDLVRLGVMLAQDGRYRGRRIVSRSFLQRATRQPSSRLNAAYGYLFWINEPGPVLGSLPGDPTRQGPMVPAAAADAFWALGLYEQWLFVSPGDDVVAVRLGTSPPAGSGFTLGRFTELAVGVAAAG